MGKRSVDYRTAALVLFIVMYPISVMAGPDVFQDTTGFSLNQGVYALFMGFWGALATFTQKFVTDRQGVRWIRRLFKDMINSTLAASIALMVCIYKEVHPAIVGVVCALSGYGGVRTMDWAYAKFINQADKATG